MDKIEKIRQEIERLKGLINDSNYYLDNSEQAVGYENALDDLNEFIGNLSEEPEFEYIRKDALLEWAKEMKEQVGLGLNAYDMGEENGKADMLNALIDELNSL